MTDKQTKVFTMQRRDGTEAKFSWDKPKGSVWYLDISHIRGDGAAIPFPELDLAKIDTLKEMLDAIAAARGENYAAQIFMDFMQPKGGDST